MSIFALLTPDLAAIEQYPLRDGDLRRIDPQHAWPAEPTDNALAQLFGGRFVRVRETARPEPGYGATLSRGPPTKLADGHWHQTWVVVPPDVASLKQTAKGMANRMGEGKISTLELARGLARNPPEPLPRTLLVLGKVDDVRTRIDAAVTAAEVKVIIDELEAF